MRDKSTGGGGGGGIGNMKVVKARGTTSGLGGRGALRRCSLGSRPLGTNAVTDPKQTNKHTRAFVLSACMYMPNSNEHHDWLTWPYA